MQFDGEKTPRAVTMLDLSDFCSPLVSQRRFYYNCTGINAMCYIKLAIGLVRSDRQVDVSKIEIKQVKEGSPIYVPANNYYACEPLPTEWLDMIPDIRNSIARFGAASGERSAVDNV